MGVLIPDGETTAVQQFIADLGEEVADRRSAAREIGPDDREHCEPVVVWMRRLAAELAAICTTREIDRAE